MSELVKELAKNGLVGILTAVLITLVVYVLKGDRKAREVAIKWYRAELSHERETFLTSLREQRSGFEAMLTRLETHWVRAIEGICGRLERLEASWPKSTQHTSKSAS